VDAPRDATPPASTAGMLLPRWARRLALRALSILGWRIDIVPPAVPKCVIIVYPHTSNWDFPIGYLAKTAGGLRAWWIGKDSLFRWPVAALFRRMGGIPVNRRESTGFIAQLVAEFERRPRMWLALAPEGTRKHTDHLKSGFYRLALAARIPVGLAYIDYRTRVVGLTTYLEMTGDEELDLSRIREVYAGKVGRHPEEASDIRFRS
jgi:1-acyl-sn-glycerol-3-phosphate acyltransferase